MLKEWLKTTAYADYELGASLGDASFRKYFILQKDGEKLLLMDSSLEMESLAKFLQVHQILSQCNIAVPKILASSKELGFLVLENFGSTHYLDILDAKSHKELYRKAMGEIVAMQKCDPSSLPLYDKEFLLFEMNLMQEWYIEKLLKRNLEPQEEQMLHKTLDTIAQTVLEQPQNLFVHRDFHSRNIMLTDDDKVGVIDFQDAMNGALLYDLVSLLQDCYICFERESVVSLVLEFKKLSTHDSTSNEQFIRWFDFMALQRHIKVLGVFARLYLRDAKDGYLKDIPLTLSYVLKNAARYDETRELGKFLESLQRAKP